MFNEEQMVFISYTSADREIVEPITDALISSGINAWMDKKRLKAGQNWDFEIRRALDKAVLIVVFISSRSTNKRGYVQRELRLALEKAEEKLIDDVYVIPVLLDNDAIIPEQIKDLQFIRYEDENFQENLVDSVQHQLLRLGIAIEFAQSKSEVTWNFYRHQESHDGIPGFEADFQLPRFSSTRYANISQIGDIVKGDLLSYLSDLRFSTLKPEVELMNFGQDRYLRTNTLDAAPLTPKVRGRVLSLAYWLNSYYAMAAHPNHHVQTYCFLVDPLCRISSLGMIFDDSTSAFNRIQDEIRHQFLNIHSNSQDEFQLDSEWVERGTKDWRDFSAFTFENDGIEFHFSPYQLAAYAVGPLSAVVKYERICQYISPIFASALEIDHLLSTLTSTSAT